MELEKTVKCEGQLV